MQLDVCAPKLKISFVAPECVELISKITFLYRVIKIIARRIHVPHSFLMTDCRVIISDRTSPITEYNRVRAFVLYSSALVSSDCNNIALSLLHKMFCNSAAIALMYNEFYITLRSLGGRYYRASTHIADAHERVESFFVDGIVFALGVPSKSPS